jgi:Flp pilus assembly protein TadG
LLADRRCVTSLELAICASAFMAMMLGLFEMGYDLFVQAALDTAVEAAARNIQVETTGQTGETSAQLAANSVCPNLQGLLNCNLLTVGVEPIPTGQDYSNTQNLITYAAAQGTTTNGVTTGGEVNTGTSGQLMLIVAWYAAPSFVGTLIPGWNAIVPFYGSTRRAHLTMSSAGFVNEFN